MTIAECGIKNLSILLVYSAFCIPNSEFKEYMELTPIGDEI